MSEDTKAILAAIAGLGARFDRIEQRLDTLESKVDTLNNELLQWSPAVPTATKSKPPRLQVVKKTDLDEPKEG